MRRRLEFVMLRLCKLETISMTTRNSQRPAEKLSYYVPNPRLYLKATEVHAESALPESHFFRLPFENDFAEFGSSLLKALQAAERINADLDETVVEFRKTVRKMRLRIFDFLTLFEDSIAIGTAVATPQSLLSAKDPIAGSKSRNSKSQGKAVAITDANPIDTLSSFQAVGLKKLEDDVQ